MRISDGSSDVCSSDLKPADRSAQNAARSAAAPQKPCIKALRHGSPLLYFLVIASPAAPPAWRAVSSSDSTVTRGSANSTPLSRSEEHTSELQSLMRISYAVFCLKKKKNITKHKKHRA